MTERIDYHRKSIRLKKYNYSENGAYFITICTQNRGHLFGEILDNIIQLNPAGEMVQKWWLKLSEKFPEIKLDEYIIMPNHIHGIIQINVGAIPCNRPIHDQVIQGENMVSPLQKYPIPNEYNGLGQYISWFKRMTTNEYIRRINSNEFPPFEKSLWQRNYYEHIIRNNISLNQIRDYIIHNPKNWKTDELFGE